MVAGIVIAIGFLINTYLLLFASFALTRLRVVLPRALPSRPDHHHPILTYNLSCSSMADNSDTNNPADATSIDDDATNADAAVLDPPPRREQLALVVGVEPDGACLFKIGEDSPSTP